MDKLMKVMSEQTEKDIICKNISKNKEILTEHDVSSIVKRISETYIDKKGINHIEGLNLPNIKIIEEVVQDLYQIFFPGYYDKEAITWSNLDYYLAGILTRVRYKLINQVEKAFGYVCINSSCKECDIQSMATNVTDEILNKIPEIRNYLKDDVQAALDGDPAAKSFDEIILGYPSIKAIATHRVAHELYLRNVPLIPRIMNEIAHSKTGIDIHPGATIGRAFFIDHGTGVVIGETTVIGNNVRIYQGVTLGGLTPSKDDMNKKRHPTIEDNVTIYAGATILGGDAVIGKGSIIGGNVWLTKSIPPNSNVKIGKLDLIFK
jgi:serine O-acetyltransferase